MINNAIAYSILFVIQTAIICSYGIWCYKRGVKHGVENTVINVLKTENIVKNISSEEV